MWHECAGKKGYKKVRFEDEDKKGNDNESGYDADDVPDMIEPSVDSDDEKDDANEDEEEVDAPAPRVSRAGRAPN